MTDKKSRKEANLYDKIFKENLEELILPMLKYQWDVQIKSMKRIRNKLQTTTEREADFLSEITDHQNQKFILHVEVQTKDETNMVYRIQEYHGNISRKYRLPVHHFVFYFGNKPSKMITRLPADTLFEGFPCWISKEKPVVGMENAFVSHIFLLNLIKTSIPYCLQAPIGIKKYLITRSCQVWNKKLK
jgi:hypothetical protein